MNKQDFIQKITADWQTILQNDNMSFLTCARCGKIMQGDPMNPRCYKCAGKRLSA